MAGGQWVALDISIASNLVSSPEPHPQGGALGSACRLAQLACAAFGADCSRRAGRLDARPAPLFATPCVQVPEGAQGSRVGPQREAVLARVLGRRPPAHQRKDDLALCESVAELTAAAPGQVDGSL